MRSAPSMRIVSPLRYSFSTIWTASARIFLRVAQTRRIRHGTAERVLKFLRQPEQHGRQEDARRDRIHADAVLREIARDRQGHRDDAALRGGVSGLPDLALISGDRGGRDDDAPLFALDGGRLDQRGRNQSDHIERADEIDADHLLEVAERMRAIFPHHALGDADPRAVDEDARRAVRLLRLRDRRTRRLPRPPRRRRRRCRRSPARPPPRRPRSDREPSTRAPLAASASAVARPSPDPAPVTIAAAPSIFMAMFSCVISVSVIASAAKQSMSPRDRPSTRSQRRRVAAVAATGADDGAAKSASERRRDPGLLRFARNDGVLTAAPRAASARSHRAPRHRRTDWRARRAD